MDALLAWIYPNRVAIAIATVVVIALVAIVGRLRGWDRTARRHPRASAAALLAAAAIGLPGAWYLGSPLFIRTELNEPPPAAVDGSDPTPTPATTARAEPSATTAPSTPTPRPTATPTPVSTPRVLVGSFVGADDFHYATGTASLIETGDGVTLRFEDLSVRNGPDLYVYLSPDPAGYVAGALELGTLKATDGSYNYDVPPGTDVSAVRSVVIWCKAFSVQFGVAALSG